jgi:hypothetical protein
VTPGEIRFDHLVGLWEDGERRLREREPTERAVLERVIAAVVDELRRRLGGAFSAQELADYYAAEGTDWCFAVAMRAAPETPAAWDMTTVANAAFARYLRGSIDFGGGSRRLRPSDRD